MYSRCILSTLCLSNARHLQFTQNSHALGFQHARPWVFKLAALYYMVDVSFCVIYNMCSIFLECVQAWRALCKSWEVTIKP